MTLPPVISALGATKSTSRLAEKNNSFTPERPAVDSLEDNNSMDAEDASKESTGRKETP
jgi:hypothetical protein